MNQTVNHPAPTSTRQPCPPWCTQDHGAVPGDDLHMSAERTAPCAVTRREDGHVCGYTRCSDPAFSKASCDAPNFAQLVADSASGITIELGHGDDLLPAMTPEAAAELGAALAGLAAAGAGPAGVAMSAAGAAREVMSGRDAEFSRGYIYGLECAANFARQEWAGLTLDEVAAPLRRLAGEERALIAASESGVKAGDR